MTLLELKGMYYDQSVAVQSMQAQLANINERIANLQQAGLLEEPEAKPTPAPKPA